VSGVLRGVLELLDLGRDGHPRQVTIAVRSRLEAERLARQVIASADQRGYLSLTPETYQAARATQPERLHERTLLLLAMPGTVAAIAGAALLDAAARSQRAHLLLMLQVPGSATVLREARARYGSGRAALRSVPVIDGEVTRQLERAARWSELIGAGRHAAAVRLLRDVAGWLQRRARPAHTSNVLLILGRILLERGRAAEADRAFEDAAAAAALAGDEPRHVRARIWQAAARTDAGRLTEAESLCRAALTCRGTSPGLQLHARAVLARVLIWQQRVPEALDLDLTPVESDGDGQADPDADADADRSTRCFVAATRVRLLLMAGRHFEAGVEARRVLQATNRDEGIARIIALTAHLRVLTATGDLALATSCMDDVAHLARQARAPLRAVRARVVLAAAQRRARVVCPREVIRLRRMAAAGPVLLRQAVDELTRAPDAPVPATVHAVVAAHASGAVDIAHLITVAHDVEKDDDAVLRVLTAVAECSRAARLDLWCNDAGAPAVLTNVGSGLTTQLGERVLELGMTIGPESRDCGREIGVPVGKGLRMIGALVARWTADTTPPSFARTLLETAAAIVHPRLEAMRAASRFAAQASLTVPELVGVSGAMRELRSAIARAAAAPFTVLIHGESGVGKELAARAIHQLSPRRQRPFNDVNCAALPDDLLESELFGHARGAFTGAVVERAGLFEAADGGTVFLDEIADLSPRGQAKLLRVLQQREVRRIGESFSRPIDVRLVAAANRDLGDEVSAERFRADLLYRLDVIRLRIPPLRERPEDVAPLALHFWVEAAPRVGTKATLTHGVLAALARYHWPGNVRELQNVVAALAVAAPARGQVRAHLLPPAITGAASIASSRLADARTQFERRAIESALARNAGNRSRAARELGLSRQGLLKMMLRLGLR
jgi:DNA-binding NtrC family response regulator